MNIRDEYDGSVLRDTVCYLTGKYRKEFDNVAEQYVKSLLLYRNMGGVLWKLGFTVISPHLNICDLDVGDRKLRAGYLDYEEGSLELLLRSDFVYLMPNWLNSVRSNTEREIAIKNGMKVYSDIRSLCTDFSEELSEYTSTDSGADDFIINEFDDDYDNGDYPNDVDEEEDEEKW
jgi:hypothetical protein